MNNTIKILFILLLGLLLSSCSATKVYFYSATVTGNIDREKSGLIRIKGNFWNQYQDILKSIEPEFTDKLIINDIHRID